MKKEKVFLNNFGISDDYKLAHVETETKNNFESTNSWLYLGRDADDPNFVKIGLTMGDLQSRSYSSANPDYYLFCAFKCKYNISEVELKNIEEEILVRLESFYRNDDGSTKRLKHHESGRPSECFRPVNFSEFFMDLHCEIYENHRNSFVICAWENEIGQIDGQFVDCIFNKVIKLEDRNKFIKMILQY
ncbi:hypothetical protein ACO0LD_30815 [Undibacterium sp. Ji83W]|uniref:hypothetical protein n=1 Tax=Undibacterium sp. Ji83W TaxID=3413043 RepID=UPI003BEFC0BC